MKRNQHQIDDGLNNRLASLRRILSAQAECSDSELVRTELRRRLQQPALTAVCRRLDRFERLNSRPRLSQRSDILLLLLYLKDRLGRAATGICGITRIQKLLFLASHELGCQTAISKPYRFQPYRLGPFSAEVYDDIEGLAQAGIICRQNIDPSGMPVIQLDAGIAAGIRGLNHNLAEIERLNTLSTQISLTARGERFARALAESARRKNPALLPALQALKAVWADRPLAELLTYVYKRYPGFTTESEILDRLLKQD
ncbi:MAG: hypothetical protein ABIK43_06850 [candidate division WOR-3 bacterium]